MRPASSASGRSLLRRRGVLLSRALPALFLALALVVVVACTAATPQKRAAQALDTVAVSVDAGMKGAAAIYKEGRVYQDEKWVVSDPTAVLMSDAEWTKLADLHEKYRRAGKVAALAIEAAGPGLADPDLILKNVKAAADEVMAFIALVRGGGAQ